METSIGFFDETARVGKIILDTLGPSIDTQKVKTYLEKVKEIYILLMKIHDEIVEVVIKTNFAIDVDEIKIILMGIEHNSLEETFRTNKWCNELKQLGIALKPLSIDANLVGSDKDIWNKFCKALEKREGEVAELYDKKLWDLRRLPYRVTDIVLLKQMLDDIATELVTQKAKFDLLAKKAESMRNRLG